MGLFNLFKKKEELFSLSYDQCKVDFHSHLLPGIDDGVKTFDESILIIENFVALGYKKIITTPHVMSDFYRNDSKTIIELKNQLNERLQEQNIDMVVDASAEYYYDDFFKNLYERDELLLIKDKYFLFELSYINEPQDIHSFVFEAHSKGLKPIMAHPERYPYWNGKIDVFKTLQEAGCLFQMNINSLVGHYHIDAQNMAELMIENQLIDFMCSDCHKIQHIEMMKKVKIKKHLKEVLESGMIKNHIFLD